MSTIEQSVEVKVPVSTAYNQWTQFEEFPRFMEGVEEVRQLDDAHLHWKAQIAGRTEEWDAEITEQRPDERVAWKSTDGAHNAGVITFHPISADATRVMAQMDVDPDGIVATAGDALGVVERRVKGDLERFRQMIEERGSESGAWRGKIERGRRVDREPASGMVGHGTGTKPSMFEPHR